MTYQYANIFLKRLCYIKDNSIGFDNISSCFCSKILHREFVACSTRFVIFPDAECAVDSTAILFCTSKKDENCIYEEQSELTEIAIHINTDHPGGVHDERLYDISGLSEFLTVNIGK